MALTKEAEETMKKLGHNIEDVEGGDTDESAAGLAPQTNENPELVQADEQVVSTTEEVQTEEQEAQKNPNDKTWQSQFDKTKLELEERDSALLKSEAEKETLMKLVGGQPQVQPQIEPQKEDLEPQLSDFIKMDEYFSDDALNPGTVSGLAYQKFNKATISFENKKSLVEYEKSQTEKQANEVAQKQALALCEAHPEFKNPFTGQPDMGKITDFINSLSNSDNVNLWADLYEFTKGKTKNNQPSREVGKRANTVLPVGALPSAETEKKPLPKSAEGMKVFGNDFEYPVGVELE